MCTWPQVVKKSAGADTCHSVTYVDVSSIEMLWMSVYERQTSALLTHLQGT